MIALTRLTAMATPFVADADGPDDDRDIPTAFASTIEAADDWPDFAHATIGAADDWPDPLHATIEDD